jgi:hypothetical protein
MVKEHCTHSWLGSFAARLIQLRPQTSIGSAVSCAVSSIHHAADMDPCLAAEIFVQMNNPDPRLSSPGARYRALLRAVMRSTTHRSDRFKSHATGALAR